MADAPHILVALIAVLTIAGCGAEDATCSTDADCFRGEICSVDDACIADPDGPTPNADTNADTGNPNSDSGGDDVDNGPPPEGACIVDPFSAVCDVPDDNDSFGDYITIEPRPPGCQGSGDDFQGAEAAIEGKQICHNETRDRYDTNLIPCDNKTFVIEVTLTPKQDCDPEHYSFNVGVQGNDCNEPNDKVRCELLDDGRKRVIAMVEPSISIAVARMTVEKKVEDMKFDYDLDIVVRE